MDFYNMDILSLNTIHNMDSLDGLQLIPSGSVKLVIADPPYFLGMTHNGKRGGFVDLAICKPFFKQMFKEIDRILTPTGEVYWFTDIRAHAFMFPIFNAALDYRNTIVWDKITGPGNFYGFTYELIIFATKDNQARKSGGNIWRIPGFGAGAKKTNGEKLIDPQKPLELIEKIVRENSEPGDIIVDPFAGSGTVPVVCEKLGRSYYAFELDEENIEISWQRQSIPQQSTFFK